ncbi:MAG: ribosome silencing factor [Clostridiales bacterium]|nr:ribosome silencing factor [Clostridiales bacterium]
MNKNSILEIAVKALDSKLAQDIEVIEINNLTVLADYFIIASGSSTTQVRALADEVEFKLKENDIPPQRIEGYTSCNWILLDYGSVVVHVFLNETRDFYSLEKLWADGKKIDVSKFISA